MRVPLSRSVALVLGIVGCGPTPDGSRAGQASAVPSLDAAKVPEELRGLVPLAQEWGIGDDVDRGAKVDGATAEERARVRTAVAPYQTRITAWLDSFGQGVVMPDEAAAFLYLQLAIEEMPPP
jgi:hypothetical protein